MKIQTTQRHHLETPATRDQIETAFADLPTLIRLFPKLNRLHIDDQRFHWTLEPLGTAGVTRVIEFATDIEFHADDGRIHIEPVHGHGNTHVSGTIEIVESAETLAMACEFHGEINVDVPFLVRGAAGPFIKHSFSQLVGAFVHRVHGHLIPS